MRIAATLLASFRRWQECDYAELCDEMETELIAQIKGEFSPTPAIVIGQAYDSLIQNPRLAAGGVFYEADHLLFTTEAVDALLAHVDRRGLFQVKTTQYFGRSINVVAKVDYIFGSQISEFKTTLGQFSAEKYMDSFQWRIYLLLFEAARLTYYVACLQEEEYPQPLFSIRALETMNLYAYPQLENDVKALVHDFADYVKTKKLESYLIPTSGVTMKAII